MYYMNNREIALDQKFDAFFTTDLGLITRTIQSNNEYKNKIDPQVILRVNEQAHTLKWRDFKYYIDDLDDHEDSMVIMYCNIFYKDARIHRLLQKDRQALKDTEFLSLGQWMISLYRINAQHDGLFPGENIYT